MSLRTQNLHYQYNPETHFRFPDVDLKNGENLLVLGGSGVGKTTWLHLLAGILTSKKGEIQIGETQINQLKNRQLDRFRGKNIGLVFQQSYFVKSLSVKENLLLSQKLAGQKQDALVIQEKLTSVGMEEKSHKLPNELSVGEQQRVSIARAVLNDPLIILADEPTSALDDENAGKTAQLLETSAEKSGANLIIVTHDARLKSRFPNMLQL